MKAFNFIELLLLGSLVFISNCKITANEGGLERTEYPEPILWYTFDETEGDTIYDHSGYGRDAIYPESNIIREPSVLVFPNDGPLRIIDAQNDTALYGIEEISFAFRVSIRDLNAITMNLIEGLHVSNGHYNYRIAYGGNSQSLKIYPENDSIIYVPCTIADTNFHNFVIVYKDTLAAAYFEGNLLRDSIIVSSRIVQKSNYRIGNRLTGALDDLKIYNSALNSYQVKTVFEADTISPTIPNGFVATSTSPNEIQLEWEPSYDSIGVAGYEIFRDSILLITTDNKVFIDEGLLQGKNYNYKIRAFDHTGNYSDFATSSIYSGLKRTEYPEPILWYSFNETGWVKTFHDQSGNNLDGTIDNSNDSLQGNSGHIIFTNPSRSIVLDTDSIMSGVGGFTLAFRVSIRNFNYSITKNLIRNSSPSGDTYYQVGYNSKNKELVIFQNDGAEAKVPLEINDTLLHDIVVVYGEAIATAYYDGVLLEDGIKVNRREVRRTLSRFAGGFEGEFDEVKVYSTALNSNQVKTIFKADTKSPTVPDDFVTTPISLSEIQLEWESSYDSIGVAGYEIFRDTTLIYTTGNNVFIDTGLLTGKTYDYKIRAFDHTGNYSEFATSSIYTGLFSLTGTVMAGRNNLDSGMVYLYKVEDSNISGMVDSSIVSNGDYQFTDIFRGDYKLRAVPLGETANYYFQRFYENGENLEEATVLFIGSGFSHVIINLIPTALGVTKIDRSQTKIYPTIVEDELSIVNTEAFNTNVDVIITNLLGVQVQNYKILQNETKALISLSHLSYGVYYVTMVSENTILNTQKIIVL